MMAALEAVVRERGIPGVVRMQGMGSRDEGERLRGELTKHIAEANEKWNRNERVRFRTKVGVGAGPGGGWDVELWCEAGSGRLVLPR